MVIEVGVCVDGVTVSGILLVTVVVVDGTLKIDGLESEDGILNVELGSNTVGFVTLLDVLGLLVKIDVAFALSETVFKEV